MATRFLALGFCMLAAALPASDAFTTPLAEQADPQMELRGVFDLASLTQLPDSKGASFGHLTLIPYLNYDTDYTDNATRVRTSPKTDFILETEPGLHARYSPRETVSVALDYEFGWHDYALNTLKAYDSNRADAEVKFSRLGFEGLSLTLSDDFIQTSNVSPLENEIASDARFDSNIGEERLQYAFNRFRISEDFSYTFEHYSDAPFNKSDFVVYSGTFDTGWQWIPQRLEIFGETTGSRTLFNVAPQTDFDTYTFQAGLRGSYWKLKFNVGAGYNFANPLNVHGETGDPSLSAKVSYQATSRISADLTASRAFQAGVRTGASLDTDLAASVNMQVPSRGKLTLSYTRNLSDRRSGDYELSVAYTTHFEYKLQRHTALNFDFTRAVRTSDVRSDNFVDDEVKVGFRLTF
jgi:hypothetical protein